MAKFLNMYNNNSIIAANDIGAITYFTNIRLLDLAGLGSYEIIELKKNHNFTNKVITELIRRRNVELIIVYESWFKDIHFDNEDYRKIGMWRIKNNVVCGGDTVSFYSRNDLAVVNSEKLNNYSKILILMKKI